MVTAAAASALAVGGVLIYIAYSAVAIRRNASRRWSTDTHIHYYFLNLMISDFILAMAGLLDIKWIVEAASLPRRVYPSPICTVQGLFMQVGDVGVALRYAIASHILQVLVLKRKSPPKFALLILAIIWLVILILVVVPNVAQHNVYGPTGHWCWINSSIMEQIGLDYIWMWLAAVLNIISYVFLVLVIKRFLVPVDGRFRWSRQQEERIMPYGTETSAESLRAVQMIFYPLVYIILLLPISVARFYQFSGHDVPVAVTSLAATLFGSSGLINTILYAFTRPKLMPGGLSHGPQSVRVTTARTAHDRFSKGYMVEDSSFVTENA
ncbi:hypothetical protein BKA82DRAFT_118540 [Pisolithus tinctorius]|uniref:G protein-coupled receptor GPR1/2/3 C-terminal domain-containing protein n=1 Tax=Pisolithus tinctorius Marx 270 TaxID=870435 RepID=A0A0C3Q049_PISTI|nr:hypothetical protein BKA82DRAFT_118540 [Pisolithus tinctorius]KIO15204.1 hypothetical protein M404DRAFT_118540 [Pisolithus tinctorius Marx 270]